MAKTGLSEATKTLIASLYEPVSIWKRAAKQGKKRDALAAVAASGEPWAICDIVPLLLDPGKDVAQSAADAINGLLNLVGSADLLALDQQMRVRSPYPWSYTFSWASLKPKQLADFERFGPAAVAVVGMATFHFDGYVREEALVRMSRLGDGREIPFLLIRLNDWVAEVRATAIKLVLERLTINYAKHFVTNLPLVTRLRETHRQSNQEIVEAIEAFLKDGDGRQALADGCTSPDGIIRRSCYKLALAARRRFDGIEEEALLQPDPLVRLQLLKTVAAEPSGALLDKLLTSARADRFAPVRRAALQISAERFPERSRSLLEEALLDFHPIVRGIAQFELDKRFGLLLRQYYLDSLNAAGDKRLCAAIAGVGETGTRADAKLVLPYAENPASKIRRAALRALAALDAEGWPDIFIEHLEDPISSVSREAAKGLSKAMHMVEGETIWKILTTTSLSHVRRNTLFLIAHLTKWESIGYLVLALASPDEKVRARSEMFIRRWYLQFNWTFTGPTKPQLERIAAALSTCGPRLDRRVRDQLEYALR